MKKHFGPKRGKPGFSKTNSSDKKGKFFKRRDDEQPSGNDRKPWEKKEKSFGDKPYKKKFGNKESGDKPWEKKSFGEKPYKKKFDNKESGDKPWEKKEKSFGEKPYKKKFGNKDHGDKPWKKKENSFDEKKNFSGSKPWEKKDKPFRKREGNDFSRRNSADRKTNFDKRDNKPEQNSSEEWLVFKNPDDAKEFISSNRNEKKSSGRSSEFSPREYKNDNRPLKANKNFSDDSSGIRLNRFIANTGICSRREADDLITAGVVKVNGKIVTELGTKITPSDTVHYGDQLLRREKMSYVLLNKPKDYITTTDDPRERKTVMHLIESAGKERIYPVGRLDRNTTGLLLFTNDGDLAERLTHPKYGVRKIYHVSLDKNLRSEDFDKIISGVEMEDGFMKADELSFVGDGLDKKEVGIVIHSGRNRIVRRLFETLGYDVVRLDRVVYAGLTKKNLPRSSFRHLTTEEVGMLKMLVGGEKKQDNHRFDARRSKGKRK